MVAESRPASEWIFIIKTNAYAGNFEREMCAYMTGMIGGCEVGDEEAKLFYEEMGLYGGPWEGVSVGYCYEDFQNPFAGIVTSRPDDHGNLRPASICCDWGQGTDAVAIFFSERPIDELIELMRRRARKYCDDYCPNHQTSHSRHEIAIQGFELWREETKATHETTWSANLPTAKGGDDAD